MNKLLISLDGVAVGDLPIDKERIRIGRRADNEIQLDHIAVSGLHATIVTILHDSFLEDHNSTNGTLVNGAPVHRHFLRDGDLIEIGRHRLYFCGTVAATREAADFEKTMVISRPFAPTALATPPAAAGTASTTPWAATEVSDSADPAIAATMAALLEPLAAFRTQAGRGRALAVDAGAAAHEGVPVLDQLDTGQVAGKAVAAGPAIGRGAAESFAMLNQQLSASEGDVRPPGDRSAAAAGDGSLAGTEGRPSDTQARLQVLNGTAAGRILEITKSLTTVGHPKVQVAVITRRSDGYHLAQVEGATPAQINGAPVAPYAMLLREHDIIEIAGIKLEFFFGA